MSNFDPVNYAELKALAAQLTAALASINANVDAAEAAMVGNNNAQTTAVNNNTNAARDNINTTTANTAADVKNHVTWVVQSFPSGGVKNVQHVAGSNANWPNGNDGIGALLYLDVPISAVNPAKAFVVPVKVTFSAATGYAQPMAYRLINGNTVRCLTFGNSTQPGAYAFEVVEFN